MNLPHENFCILPWISLEASPIGTVRPCCLADDEIVDNNGHKCVLGETSFDEIRDSDHMKMLRQDFLRGERPSTCRRCWAEEDAGRISKRQHTLNRLKHVIRDITWSEQAAPIQFIDLKLGNICNLKCRICGSWSSSTYAAEEIRFQKDKRNNFHYTMMKMGQWPRENTKFWQEITDHMSTLRYLEFTGGEPFMIQEHFNLLKQLVEKGFANQIEIHYNTNGTIFPIGAEDLWRHFKHVEIAFSIDDVDKRFEYQRSGANWVEVNGHIDLFKEIRARNSNISLQVCTTVNVFNIMYLDDVARWIDTQNFNFVYWNMLHDGPQFCIANLPPKAKTVAELRLRQAYFSNNHRLEIDRIIDFMNRGTYDLSVSLCDSIRQTDERRNQNLISVAPELATAIGYHD